MLSAITREARLNYGAHWSTQILKEVGEDSYERARDAIELMESTAETSGDPIMNYQR